MRSLRQVKEALSCQLCWRITLTVFGLILVVESAILVPTAQRFVQGELDRLANHAVIALEPALLVGGEARLAEFGAMVGQYNLAGIALYGRDGRAILRAGEHGSLAYTDDLSRAAGMMAERIGRSVDGSRLDIAWRSGRAGEPLVIARLDASHMRGEARAYPRNIMEVHEMVNDTLGGRRIAIPYCTLCRSAQAYFTDEAPGYRPLLRTSGLLSRSNKFMYDLSTWSAVDTFTGKAISGPLRAAVVTLRQATAVTSSCGAWRAAHPKTTIVAPDGGIGRSYPCDPLHGRDDKGPIFPVGDVDPRLGVHEVVLGVTAANGKPVSFARAAARLALSAGERVTIAGVSVRADGDGLRAFIGAAKAPAHEAFWFAWSQFHPGTLLWERGR
ncbi:MAG: DUF3179 domain-containing protein [Betaproteobacteria bacterium]|nr:DUF3179 domain-containing protein [Betaproteobacteria bacterium]